MAEGRMRSRKAGAVARMVFDNPERRNAVSLEMWEEAAAILDDFAGDPDVRVVVLSGAGGKAFVSGADVSRFRDERSGEEAVRNYNARVAAANDMLESLPKPTIAEIDGFCIGGGLGLALCCDLRFCSAKSQFALPAARLGLGYGFAGLKRLVDAVGPGAARDMAFSARRLDSAEALRVGLVQKVAEDGALAEFVDAYAASVAANAPLTVKGMKLVIAEALKPESARDLDLCRTLVDDCYRSRDYVEGRTAFMEKRPPAFQGR